MATSNYPNQTPWTDKKDWVSPSQPGDLVEAAHVNQLYAEVNAIGSDVVSHKSDNMPHVTADGNYRWGFKVVSGDLQFVYEEV